MKLIKGGIESIIVAVLLIAVVIGLIGTVVINMTNKGQDTVGKSVDRLSAGQVKMQ
ncbi:MAG: hypothetical protein IJS47_00020 [Clostridia bacterium]|nr:hypothetical protein [Clostridia bacterium]